MIRLSLLVGLGCVLALGGVAADQEFDPYTVRSLDVRVEADSAVAAKEEAFDRAAAMGLQRVLRRIAAPADGESLPAAQTEARDLLDHVSLESERVGPASYRGRFTLAFSPIAVRGYLTRHDVPWVDRAAPPVLLIPVFVDAGIPLWWDAAEEWASVLDQTDFEDGLTPAKLPDNSPADIAERRDRILAGDRITLDDLRVRYGAEGAVVVTAERTPGRERIELSFVGTDAIGRIEKHESVSGGLAAAAQRAADIMSDRWKRAAIDDVAARPATGVALAVRVLLHGGQEEWAEIQRRLQESGLLHGLTVETMGSRSASVLIWHDRDDRDLAAQLERHRLDLFEAGGAWLLQSY